MRFLRIIVKKNKKKLLIQKKKTTFAKKMKVVYTKNEYININNFKIKVV